MDAVRVAESRLENLATNVETALVAAIDLSQGLTTMRTFRLLHELLLDHPVGGIATHPTAGNPAAGVVFTLLLTVRFGTLTLLAPTVIGVVSAHLTVDDEAILPLAHPLLLSPRPCVPRGSRYPLRS